MADGDHKIGIREYTINIITIGIESVEANSISYMGYTLLTTMYFEEIITSVIYELTYANKYLFETSTWL